MLYSIIPPILIVASLVAIIIFLAKKSDKVSQLSIEEIIREEEERKIMMEDAGFFQKISLRIKNIKWDDLKHGLLALLEKITRKSRVVFLKLESKFGGWSENIREKRKVRTERKMLVKNSEKKENIFQKIREYKPERKIGQPETEEKEEIGIKKPAFERREFKKTEDDEKIIKPIISEKMVRPRKAEMRDRLEELLIERIAANPKDLEAYERLGQYYMEIKGYADAKECFKQVIKLDPGNRNAKYRLKRLETLLAQ